MAVLIGLSHPMVTPRTARMWSTTHGAEVVETIGTRQKCKHGRQQGSSPLFLLATSPAVAAWAHLVTIRNLSAPRATIQAGSMCTLKVLLQYLVTIHTRSRTFLLQLRVYVRRYRPIVGIVLTAVHRWL